MPEGLKETSDYPVQHPVSSMIRSRLAQMVFLLGSIMVISGCASRPGMPLKDIYSIETPAGQAGRKYRGLEDIEARKTIDIKISIKDTRIEIDGPESLRLELGQSIVVKLEGNRVRKECANDYVRVVLIVKDLESGKWIETNKSMDCVFRHFSYKDVTFDWSCLKDLCGEKINPTEEIHIIIKAKSYLSEGRHEVTVNPVFSGSRESLVK